MALVRPKVFITYKDVPKKVLDLFTKDCDVTLSNDSNATRKELLEKSRGMDGILWVSDSKIDGEFFDVAGPQLKAIFTLSSDLEYVNLAEVKRRKVLLASTPLVLNKSGVADTAVGLLVAAARRFHDGRKMMENNEWVMASPTMLLGQDFKDSTVGIVGLGKIGQEIVYRLTGFKIGRFIYCGHAAKPEGDLLGAHFVSFDELLTTSDFVVVACSLNDETKHLFNTGSFAKMKPTSVFVNIARGEVVDQEALIAALRNGTIFAAGLEVMTSETIPADHPLMQLDNLVLLPQITERSIKDSWMIASHNVLLRVAGEPMLSPVDLN